MTKDECEILAAIERRINEAELDPSDVLSFAFMERFVWGPPWSLLPVPPIPRFVTSRKGEDQIGQL